MIILDSPYVSDLLLESIRQENWPVLENEFSRNIESIRQQRIGETAFERLFQEGAMVYSNTENSITWVRKHFPGSDYERLVSLFKDKYEFRLAIQSAFPTYWFMRENLSTLEAIPLEELRFPFVLKPAVGFMSIGVSYVENELQWNEVIRNTKEQMRQLEGVFPQEVVGSQQFLLEQWMPGEEYAIDVFYDKPGKPNVVNMMKHYFASDADVSDRLYITSSTIIREQMPVFQDFLEKLGELLGIRQFPLHIELRHDGDNVFPIEVNPMRFAGWGTTDLAQFAYGINPYKCLFDEQTPNWEKALAGKEDKVYGLMVIERPSKFDISQIEDFDYELLEKSLEKPLMIRRIDFRKFPIFAFVFTETRIGNFSELENLLKSDLSEFIRLKQS